MQTYETIMEQVTDLIKPLVSEDQSLTENTDLVSDLGFDSLKVMGLLEDIEDRFDISVPLNILPDIRTIKDFAVQLQRILGEN